MTKNEYEQAHILLMDNKYEYVSGRKPIPALVGRLLAAHYLWPYEDEYWSHSFLLDCINSHE